MIYSLYRMLPIGYCGQVPLSDARVFGPAMWTMLHLIAQNYPGAIGDATLPNNATVLACEAFVVNFPVMMPSHGDNFKATLARHASAAHMCQSGTTFQQALVDAHNNISALTQAGPDPWTYQQAADEYTNASMCLTDTQWGKEEVCRTAEPGQTCRVDSCDGCKPYTGAFAPKGYCGNLPTANPRVFGPHVWRTLHTMAQHYPDEPYSWVVDSCNQFVGSLPLMLPCDHCGYHLTQTIHMYDGSPPCSGAHALQAFMVWAHNRVSEHVHPSRKPWTVDDAAQQYDSTHACLHNSIVNGSTADAARGVYYPRSSDSSIDLTVVLLSVALAIAILLQIASR